jgi:hypothetical protein
MAREAKARAMTMIMRLVDEIIKAHILGEMRIRPCN